MLYRNFVRNSLEIFSRGIMINRGCFLLILMFGGDVLKDSFLFLKMANRL